MKIAIGADHRGYHQKEIIKQHFDTIEWIDVGAYDDERSDYPIFAHKVVRIIIDKKADYGVLLCGTGIGMAIAANRYPEIYAAVAWNMSVAHKSKSDDNANVLVLPSDYITSNELMGIIQNWLQTTFKGGRYAKRIAMIDKV